MSFNREKLSDKEKAVYDFIAVSGKPVTQLDIMRSNEWLGCHPFEDHLPIDKQQSTLRQIRQIIHDLRMKHDAPIISGVDGYWIPSSDDEVRNYISKRERESKAQAASWMVMYRQMVKIFGEAARNDYFDGQQRLF